MSRYNDKHLHSMDAKGRLQLRREIRATFKLKKGDVLHLVPNLDDPPFLEVHTNAQWKEYQALVMSQASGALKRNFVRFVELYKETVTADAQGRFSIPKRLRELCKLDGEVAVINLNSFVEVWNTDYIDQKSPDLKKAFNDFKNELF